ncbi:MAG: imidazole glycerol phosphate synthase subunit HisH, partial [Prolixibacteraceae bacterium]|nr:imidazole glycerol phosphate synthase subunit HisH [Prolixibacteraceae bacterium]
MKIVIIKYNAGNIESVKNALLRLGVEGEITDDPQKIHQADKVIFPGVGEAVTTMKYLKDKGLDKLIISLKQPVLGFCLGLQLMCKFTEEGN